MDIKTTLETLELVLLGPQQEPQHHRVKRGSFVRRRVGHVWFPAHLGDLYMVKDIHFNTHYKEGLVILQCTTSSLRLSIPFPKFKEVFETVKVTICGE